MTVEYGAAALDLDLTTRLCELLSGVHYDALPENVVHEAKRGIVDWLGCALAGSGHPTIDKLTGVLRDLSGKEQATVLGRKLRLGLLEAPLANGQMGHLLDYDDTHMGGVVLHTSSPVLASLFALADARGIDGRTFIAAYVVGFEAGIRAGRSAPEHHDGGWHLTGTLGHVAAGAASARLMALDARSFTCALGIATTQASGMQQNRGTMCKSFHAGRAASNGVLAALLAERGFDSSPEILEGRRGFSRIYSASTDTGALLDRLGEDWTITTNGYKPYACGVVLHPLIDAMIRVARENDFDDADIGRVDARVNPAMIRITGVESPRTGLQSKFSLQHSGAVAFIDRAAGVAQYADEKATDPRIDRLRRKIVAHPDASLRKDEAEVTVRTVSGAGVTVHVDHATGTRDNPLSDCALADKFLANAVPVIGRANAELVVDRVWAFDGVDDVRSVTGACA